MQIKILQLNMCGGKHFHALADFLRRNEFDLLCFQEVGDINPQKNIERETYHCFNDLQQILGSSFSGKITHHNTFAPDAVYAKQGNAIFYRKNFEVLDTQTLWLYKRDNPFPANQTSFEDMGRNALCMTFCIDDKKLTVVNTHLAWARTPIEQPHERAQNIKLVAYMKNLPRPFILAGDFNIKPGEPSIKDLEKYGRNLTAEYHVTNTVDPTLHHSWDNIKPGFPVDYIFVSPDVQVDSFEALDSIHMSDHIGLTAQIEI